MLCLRGNLVKMSNPLSKSKKCGNFCDPERATSMPVIAPAFRFGLSWTPVDCACRAMFKLSIRQDDNYLFWTDFFEVCSCGNCPSHFFFGLYRARFADDNVPRNLARCTHFRGRSIRPNINICFIPTKLSLKCAVPTLPFKTYFERRHDPTVYPNLWHLARLESVAERLEKVQRETEELRIEFPNLPNLW